MSVRVLPVTHAVESVRQGGGLTRLRDENGELTPVIQVADLEPTGIAVSSLTRETLSLQKAHKHRAELHQVLLSQFSSKLRAALVDETVVASGAIVGTNISIISPNAAVALPQYLVALFNSQAFHARMERLTGGSTLSQLSVTDLKSLEIPIPTKARQVELGKAFMHATAVAQAAHRIVEAQSVLIEHDVLDLWDEATRDG